MNLKYVPEYDGLRSIAVIGVLIFHFGFKIFPGGFVGVDVFFVISGFLISKIILNDISAGKFSIVQFYERRFRRIIPALVSVLIITCIIFSLIISPAELDVQRTSLLSTLLSISNIYFYITTDYFNNNETNPFLHTWSLAVEEQFYIFFPLLLVAISRWPVKWRNSVLAALGFISFGVSSYYVHKNASAAFYLPWFRAWELMAGTGIALFPKNSIPYLFKHIASYTGPVIIIAAFIFFDEKMIFPGAIAVIPVAGAALTIIGSGVHSLPNRILSSSLSGFIGKISYSLYLVHWPVICALSVVGLRTGGALGVVALVFCLVIAWLNYKFVEQPFRTPQLNSARKTYAATASALILVAVIGLGSDFITKSLWARSPKALELAQVQQNSRNHFGQASCFLNSGRNDFSLFDKNLCLHINPNKKNILVMGDSHSAHFMSSLTTLFPNTNFLQASASGCLPLPNAIGEKRCIELINYLFNEWLPKYGNNLDAVILSAQWQAQSTSKITNVQDRIEKLGSRLIIIGPSPEYVIPLPKILAYAELYNIDLTSELLKKARLLVDEELRTSLPKRISYFSLTANLCRSKEECRTTVNDLPILLDRDHFTEKGADLALIGFAPCLEPSSLYCAR